MWKVPLLLSFYFLGVLVQKIRDRCAVPIVLAPFQIPLLNFWKVLLPILRQKLKML